MKTDEVYKYGLGTVIVIGFFTTLVFMILDGNYKVEVNMIVGALIGAFITVVGYSFGSSQGSADKTKLINKSQGNENI